MSTFYVFVIVIAFFLLFVRSRILWLNYHIECYTVTSSLYITQTKQPESVAREMAEMWPTQDMLWELWRWDFDRYIVSQDRLEDMLEWRDEELLKANTLDSYMQGGNDSGSPGA